MADFWRDLIWTAVRDTTNTLSVVMPGVLAMLALVVLGAVVGWIGGALVRRLAHAGDLAARRGARLRPRGAGWLALLLARATAPTELGRAGDWFRAPSAPLSGGLAPPRPPACALGGRPPPRHILERGRLRERVPSD